MLRLLALILVAALASSQVVQPPKAEPGEEIASWAPTHDDKPWDEKAFGDSTKIPLQPALTPNTIDFVKNVLNKDTQPPPLGSLQYESPAQDGIDRSAPAPNLSPAATAADVKQRFDSFDQHGYGQLELGLANNLFSHYKIYFSDVSEMNNYFYKSVMPFDVFCDLLAERGILTPATAHNATVNWVINDLQLDPQSLDDRSSFRIKHRAVVWYKRWLANKQTWEHTPPNPPGDNDSEVEIGKQGIVEYVKISSGRPDEVRYDNVHLTLEEVQQMMKEKKVSEMNIPCHPAIAESCEFGTTVCCQGQCCPLANGSTEGYCAEKC
jgi:hypothetical protein